MIEIVCEHALRFLRELDDQSVDLFCFDPPYFGIVNEKWDNQWADARAYTEWMRSILIVMKEKSQPYGSCVFFQGIGKHGQHSIFDVVRDAEAVGWYFRDWITWKKRRAYGCKDRYLYCREEILWFSRHESKWAFNVPYLDEKRGYDGWDPKHPAKSEYKRVSNVWADVPELMRPERTAQKPVPLIERLVATHSMLGGLVVDPFVGWGTTAVACARLDMRFKGCDVDGVEVDKARRRVEEACVR